MKIIKALLIITETIIGFAQKLNKKVIAEFVYSKEAFEIVKELGVELRSMVLFCGAYGVYKVILFLHYVEVTAFICSLYKSLFEFAIKCQKKNICVVCIYFFVILKQ